MGAAAAASGGDAAYVPGGAIVVNGSDEYLDHTPTGAGNRQKYSFSCWTKITNNNTSNGYLIDAGPIAGNGEGIRYTGSSSTPLLITGAGGVGYSNRVTSAIYRDTTAWNHVFYIKDTTNSNPSSRLRLFVNGEEVTDFSATQNPPLNDANGNMNNTNTHRLGGNAGQATPSQLYSGYYSEVILLDGYVALPTDFGQYDSNNVWVPIDPTTVVTAGKGTNGFWLDFADSSDLGNDVSYSGLSVGTDNSFTPVNMGTANSVLDRPADDAATNVGNYATWNPLDQQYSGFTYAEGNKRISTGTSSGGQTTSTIAVGSGRYYAEVLINSWATSNGVGIAKPGQPNNGSVNVHLQNVIVGKIYNNGVENQTGLTTLSATNVVGIDLDIDGGTVQFYLNNSTYGSAESLTAGEGYAIFAQSGGNSADLTLRTEPADWSYSAKGTGVPFCTAKLPEPTVKNGEKYFLPMIYEGNGGGQRVGNFIPFTDSHTVSNSCLFEDADSDHMNRTFVTPTSAYKWTFSTWFKRGKLGEITFIGQGDYNGVYTALHFNGSDQFQFQERGSGVWNTLLTSNREFKDTSNWHNLVLAYDTATSTTATKVYIDGSEITSWAAETNPTSTNTASSWNAAGTAWIGEVPTNTPGYYMDGYLAETMFIDGYALSASVFGQTDTSTNRWIPKEVTTATINTAGGGSSGWGNNGFYLAYGTDSALGDDTSGEGHDWTVNNITSANQMDDTPTKNIATLDNNAPTSQTGSVTVSDGNRKVVGPSSAFFGVPSTMTLPSSGKFYAEAQINGAGTSSKGGGVYVMEVGTELDVVTYTGGQEAVWGWHFQNNRHLVEHGSDTSVAVANADGDIAQIAIDIDNAKVYMGINDTWYSAVNTTTTAPDNSGTATFSLNCAGMQIAANGYGSSGSVVMNFGATTFAHTPPTDFVALNQDNLAANTAGITGFSWIKNRDATDNHILQDRVRGVYNYLSSNNADLEATNVNSVKRFLQQGVQVGNMDAVNTSAESYVLWQWAANGTGTLNELGSIDSTVSANTDAGFSIVKYTGEGSAATVGHGLSTAPSVVVNKTLGSGSTDPNWQIYHVGMGATKAMFFNTTGGPATSSSYWNNVAPTPTVFSIGTDRDSAVEYINYCFAEVEGYSKFGTYIGNNSADGTFVYLGFRPAWVMVKRLEAGYAWHIHNSAMSPYNPVAEGLNANDTGAEATATRCDFTANGFKLRTTDGGYNGSATYIYLAFAENPFGGAGVGQARAE